MRWNKLGFALTLAALWCAMAETARDTTTSRVLS